MQGLGVLLVLGGAAALYYVNLSRSAGNLNYLPGNVTGFSLSGISPIIYADLIVQNTSNVTFTINSLSANVLTDSTRIGNLANFTPVQIPGNSQGVIPLTLQLEPLTLVNDIIGIITGGSGKKNLIIQGTVNANGIQAPFSLSYKLGV